MTRVARRVISITAGRSRSPYIATWLSLLARDDSMERLIQLLDEVDDVVAPALGALTQRQWLRVVAVGTLMLVLLRVGLYWPLAIGGALPVLPLVDLVRAGLRRVLPAGFATPLRASFDIEA